MSRYLQENNCHSIYERASAAFNVSATDGINSDNIAIYAEAGADHPYILRGIVCDGLYEALSAMDCIGYYTTIKYKIYEKKIVR